MAKHNQFLAVVEEEKERDEMLNIMCLYLVLYLCSV